MSLENWSAGQFGSTIAGQFGQSTRKNHIIQQRSTSKKVSLITRPRTFWFVIKLYYMCMLLKSPSAVIVVNVLHSFVRWLIPS